MPDRDLHFAHEVTLDASQVIRLHNLSLIEGNFDACRHRHHQDDLTAAAAAIEVLRTIITHPKEPA